MRKRELDENWSNIKFPTERPPNKDFVLWRTAENSIVPVEGIPDKLGKLMHNRHKVWDWRYDLQKQTSAPPARDQDGHPHTIKHGREEKHGQPMDKIKDESTSRIMWESMHCEVCRYSSKDCNLICGST